MAKFSATTPIYYVNAKPHLGHAYTTIVADAVSRWHRLCGDDVHLLTGTDEHGLKIQQAATRAGTTPRAFVDGTAARFQAMADRMDCAYDRFIRTTEPDHYAAAQEIWRRIGMPGAVADARVPRDTAWGGYRAGAPVEKGDPLFPRRTLERE